ncbi:MAG: sodium:solute symporter [Oligosphaeraceae bacterium]
MNMHPVDWTILGLLLLALILTLRHFRRHVHSCTDFLAAGRLGGRYLLAISSGMSGVGAVTIIAAFEMSYAAGFPPVWWGFLSGVTGIVAALSGWVLYRFRETRALTLPQFLEMRYSRRFRIFAGCLAWISGVANYGIFPAVSLRFFLYFCGIPEQFSLWGTEFQTLPLLMAAALALGAWFAISGGQVAIMVTDFLQGMFCNLVFLAILIFFFTRFSRETIVSTLVSLGEQAPQASLVNPFHTGAVRDFNPWFFLINTVAAFYSVGAWLGSQGFQVAAKSPHEQKMAGLLGNWRAIVQNILYLFIPVCALVVMHHPDFLPLGRQVQQTLDTVKNPQIREQLVVPMALLKLLPPGMMGLFVAVMFAAMLSTDNTYMHSWGSIMVQDILMPLRKKPFSPKAHLLALRISIASVGILAFLISLFYRQTQYIMLYCNITGAIFLGGAGAVIIGGLYWKGGTTLGAWCALILGSLLATGNILLCHLLPPWFQNAQGRPLLNEQWGFALSIAGAVVSYLLGSFLERLWTGRREFCLDRMLHRNQYADAQSAHPAKGLRALGWSEEFTTGDKFLFFASLGWTLLWFAVGILLAFLEGLNLMSEERWANFWFWYVAGGLVVGGATTLMFLLGGFRDMVQLQKDLMTERKTIPNAPRDDGWVPTEEQKEEGGDAGSHEKRTIL